MTALPFTAQRHRGSVAMPCMVASGLHRANVATLFGLVACNGVRNTTIEISNQRFAPANRSFLTAR
jgi:hypothetical protein